MNKMQLHKILDKYIPRAKIDNIIKEYSDMSERVAGWHLLDEDLPVIIVDNREIAIVGALLKPQCIWLAGAPSEDYNPLKGRNVFVFPSSHASDYNWILSGIDGWHLDGKKWIKGQGIARRVGGIPSPMALIREYIGKKADEADRMAERQTIVSRLIWYFEHIFPDIAPHNWKY